MEENVVKSEELIEVEIDHLKVEVDKQEWEENPAKVIEEVRHNRQNMRIEPLDDVDRDPDYQELYPDEPQDSEPIEVPDTTPPEDDSSKGSE